MEEWYSMERLCFGMAQVSRTASVVSPWRAGRCQAFTSIGIKHLPAALSSNLAIQTSGHIFFILFPSPDFILPSILPSIYLGRARRRWASNRWIPRRSASYRRAAARWTPAQGDPQRTASAQHRCGPAEAHGAGRGDGTKTLGTEDVGTKEWHQGKNLKEFGGTVWWHFSFWDCSVNCGGGWKRCHSKIDVNKL